MANVENVVVTKFRADISDLQSGLRSVQTQLGQVQGAAGGINKTGAAMTALGTAAGIAGAMLVSKIIQPLTALPALGVKLAAQYEQTQIAFTTMLGSAQDANAFLDELKDFAARTPFELTGLLESAKMMQAFGFEAEEVVPTLTAVGDASAALGLGTAGVGRITLALGQMKAMGRVLTQDLKQLQFAGVPAVQMLADSFGKTVPEMQKMISAGEVASDVAIPMLIKAMQEGTENTKGFGGMMEAQSKTFSGVMSTFKDEAEFALIDGVMPALKSATAAMKEMTPIIRPLVGTIGNLIGQGFKALADAVLLVVRPIIQLREFMQGLRDGTQRLSEPLMLLMATFRDLGESIKAGLNRTLDALRAAFDEFVRPAIQRLFGVIQKNAPLLAELNVAFRKVVDILSKYVMPIIMKVAGFFIGLFVDAIGKVIDTVIKLAVIFSRNMTSIVNAFIGAYNFMLPAINGFLRAIGQSENQLKPLNKVTNDLGNTYVQTAAAARESAREAARFGNQAEGLRGSLRPATEDVEDFGGGMTETGKKSKEAADKLKKMQDAFNKLANDANSARDSMLGMTRSVYGELSDLEEALQPENLNIKGVISITDELMQLGEKIVAPLKAMGGGVGKLAQQVQQGFNQVVVSARDNFARLLNERASIEAQLAANETAYRSRIEDINKTFDALDKEAAARVKSLESYYDNLIAGLRTQLDGARAAFEEADNKLKGLVQERQTFLDGIAKGMRGFLNALSFKKEADQIKRTVETTVKDLGNGMKAYITQYIDEPVSGGFNIKEQLEQRLQAMRDFAANIRTLAAKGLDEALIKDFVSAGVSGAGDVVSSLAGASAEEIAAINATQAALAAEVTNFSQFASEQWFDAAIAQQEAIVAPLQTSYEQAQAALNNAEVLRQAELAAAQAQVDILREQRQAAIAQADADYAAQRTTLEAERDRVDAAIRQQATDLQNAMQNFGDQTVKMMEWAGNESRKKFKEGFNKKFPDMASRLNQMMTNLAESMRRETTITVTTVHRSVYESIDGRAMGGTVAARQAYIVGERGPEIFMPSMAGRILTAGQTQRALSGMSSATPMGAAFGGGGGGGNVITIAPNAISVNVSGGNGEGVRGAVDQAFEDLVRELKAL